MLNRISKLCVYGAYLKPRTETTLELSNLLNGGSCFLVLFFLSFTPKYWIQCFSGVVGRLEANSYCLSVLSGYATPSKACEMPFLIDIEKTLHNSTLKFRLFHRISIENYLNYTVMHVNFSISPPNKFCN